MASSCYIALGSNLGKREENMHRALDAIARLPGTRVSAVSDFITTAAVGGPAGQGDYLNAAAQVTTGLLPEQFLAELLVIERDMGRDRMREVRHGPRNIDLDILLYDNTIIDKPELTIPHPRMHERLFVLRPLAQVAPEVVHPVIGQTVSALLHKLEAGVANRSIG